MEKKVKPMSLVFTILSGLYLFFVVQSKDVILVTDEVGGDPGGKLMPMVIAIFTFLGFLYLTIKEKPSDDKMKDGTKRLFLFTLILSILYVVLMRHLGFVILSTILLYSLEYVNTTIDEDRNWKHFILGLLATVLLISVVYSLMRIITINLTRFGRVGNLPGIFKSSVFQASISLVFVALAMLLINKIFGQRMRDKGLNRIFNSGLITIGLVLFLYISFKQFFGINLAPGLLNL